jgi:hypothetical protein
VDVVSHGSSIGATGISAEQRSRFTAHGWLLLPSVLTEEYTERLLVATDGLLARLQPWDREALNGCREPHLFDPTFLDWFLVPGLVDALGQLIGNPKPRVRHSIVLETRPHPARNVDAEDLRDPHEWDWHRDFTPHSIVRRDPAEPHLLCSQAVVSTTYLTPTSPARGATALLDASHLVDGGFADMPDDLPVVQVDAPAGSIVIFSEALFHAAPPVTDADRRVALLTWMTAPWFVGDDVAPPDLQRLADERLRSVFRPPRFGDDR